ncbi:MAG TPA: nuclear pore complex subunit [Bacteroidales bacterium]|nr:nuclear pore complex subunit [Bacteroidales bacterium]
MKRLIVSSTDYTPALDLNPANLTMVFKGVSRPENVGLFYQQVIDWVDDIAAKAEQLTTKAIKIIFKLDYCNSASQKYILIFLERLLELRNKGFSLDVEWHYDEGDDKMLEDGEDIADAVGIEFSFHTF